MVVVAVSGFFDPLHMGHVEYLKLAKELGDKLVVIVDNDKQARIKKGFSFMNEKERIAIIESLKFVGEVFLSIDEDITVRRSLEAIKPDIFAKGGDRFAGEIPEKEICDKYGIRIIDGLGGKIQSSSALTENIPKRVEKPWGYYTDFLREGGFVLKELGINSGQAFSLQSHENREEHWIVIGGDGEVQIGDDRKRVLIGEHICVRKGEKHRLLNDGDELLRVAEVQLGNCSEDDIVRYEDMYGRG